MMARKKNEKDSALDKVILGAQKFLPKIMQPTPEAPKFIPPTQSSSSSSTKSSSSSTSNQPKKTSYTYEGVTGPVTISSNTGIQNNTVDKLKGGQTMKQIVGQTEADIARIESGRLTAEEEQALMLQQQQAQIQAQALLQPQNLQGIEGQPSQIDYKQAALSTVADPSTYRNIGTYAAGGAIAGSAVPVLGTIAGAALGAAVGIWQSVKSNINTQKKEGISAYAQELNQGKTDLKNIATLIEAGAISPEEGIEYFNLQQEKIYRAYANLKADTSTNLNLILEEDATRELQKFEDYYAQGGYRDFINAKMQIALVTPNKEAALASLAMSQQTTTDG